MLKDSYESKIITLESKLKESSDKIIIIQTQARFNEEMTEKQTELKEGGSKILKSSPGFNANWSYIGISIPKDGVIKLKLKYASGGMG